MSIFSSAYFSEIQWLKPVFPVNKPVPVAVSASFRFLATIRDPDTNRLFRRFVEKTIFHFF